MIESLSLIDAVMPDVVESRKQAAVKNQQIKTEPNGTNGDESSGPTIGEQHYVYDNKDKPKNKMKIFLCGLQ